MGQGSRFLDKKERLEHVEISLADEDDQLSLHRPQKCMALAAVTAVTRHTFLRPMQRELIVLVRQRNLNCLEAFIPVQESRSKTH